MAVQIRVPEMGESVVDARVRRWLKKAGDAVTVGEPLVELETDKVDVEVSAPKTGVLASIAHGEGADVKIGQGTDWMEIVGCGMVHPNVLRNCGLDPDQWQGFAFGFGIDRLGTLKYGMPDLRDMFASDVRWLDHYGFSAFQAPNTATGLS